VNSYSFAWLLARPWAFLVDLHPRLRALRASEDGAAIVDALARVYPEMPSHRRERLLRATLRQRAYNVAITQALSYLGRASKWIGRMIPIRDRELVRVLLESDRPLILVTFHTGPVYLLFATIHRSLVQRTMYAMHQSEGLLFTEIERLLSALGAVSVPNTVMAPRKLIRALRTGRRPIVMYGCDYAPGSLPADFLGFKIGVAEGARLLYEATDADVICAVWERPGLLFPHVRFTRPIASQSQGRISGSTLVANIFAELDRVVAPAPHRWTAWETFSARCLGIGESKTPL
jgi:lauroyl/myristoyl acyltransferase